MSLRQKIVLSFLLFVGALASANLLATSWIIDRRVHDDLETSEVTFAKSLAVRAAKNTRTKDRVALTEMVLDEQGLWQGKIGYLAIFGQDGALLAHTYLTPIPRSVRELDNTFQAKAPELTLIDNDELFAYDVAVPIVEGIEQIGAIHVGLRGAYLQAIKRDVLRSNLVASGFACLAAFALALLLSSYLVRPLAQLTAVVNAISGGRWDALDRLRLGKRGRDEVGALGTAFTSMATAVLEKTQAMRLMLDNMGDGLLTVSLAGELHGEVSAEAARCFGTPAPGTAVWDYLFPGQEELIARFRIGFEQLVEDLLPFLLLADQMPREFSRGEHTYRLEYRQVRVAGNPDRVLVVVRDVSAQVQAEQQHARAEELHALIGNLLRDRQAFKRFLTDTAELFARLRSEADIFKQKRDLHTLKGNLAVMGCTSVAALCHGLEDQLAESGEAVSEQAIDALLASWNDSLAALEAQVPLEEGADQVAVRGTEYERLLRKIEAQTEHTTLLTIARSWRLLPAASILDALSTQAGRLAKTLGKDVAVRVQDQDVRLDIAQAGDFWSSLVHVVRNAVDHGLETSEMRVAAGKPAVGALSLATYSEQGRLVVVVADDGAGVDWDAVRSHAHLPADATEEELEAELFSDGFTTRESASLVSGRGVGLAAVKAACTIHDIEIEIKSHRGKGTSFIFRFPAEDAERPSHVAIVSVPPRPDLEPQAGGQPGVAPLPH